jgi:hypothetical protein
LQLEKAFTGCDQKEGLERKELAEIASQFEG